MSRRRWINSLVVLSAAVASGGCDGSTGPAYVASVVIEPDSAHLEPGESATFTAVPLGPRDQRYPERAPRVDWNLVGSEVLEMEDLGEGVVRVTAKEVGAGRVEAALGRGEGAAPVYVRPPGLVGIEIEPSPIVVRQFTGTAVRAVLRDASGAEISPEGFRVSWEPENEDIAFMSPNARHQVRTAISGRFPGRTTLLLVVGPLTTRTSVTVTSPPPG